MDNELWKPIANYEGLYEISNKGNIRSVDRVVSASKKGTLHHRHLKGKLMTPFYNNLGYLLISLSKDGVSKTFSVHRLVALAFVPNPNNKPCVNHLDETHDNNCASNLEWCTQKENMNYGTAPQRIGETLRKQWRDGKIKRRYRQVAQYSMDGTLLNIYPSYIAATRACGSSSTGTPIINCINGKVPHAYGYKWAYCERLNEKGEKNIELERKD